MINIIALEIALQAINLEAEDNDISWIDVDAVLNKIEQKGMLPPRTDLPKLGISDNAWEPENE